MVIGVRYSLYYVLLVIPLRRQARPKNIMATTGEVTHNLLVRELCKVTEWDVLGIYLGLDESEITEIERDHQSIDN